MSPDQPTQVLEPGMVDPPRSKDATPGRYQCGDPIPLACDTADLARIWGKSRSRIRQLKALGKFNRFELKDPVDRSKRWSGILIQRHFEQEPGAARSFGAHRRG